MSERYTILFSLPGNLYAEGAPVLIAAGNLLKDNETGKVVVQLKLQNIREKPVKALRVRLTSFDTVGKPLGEPVDHQYLDLTARRDDSFGQKTAIPLPDASARSFAAEVTETVFTDNTMWTACGEAWEPLPEGESLWSWLGDEELVKQYKLQYGQACAYRPKQVKDLWFCACGAVNHSGEAQCQLCGSTFADLMAVDLKRLKADRDARLAEERQERERREAEAQVRAKKVKKTAAILGSLGAAAAVFLIVLFTVIVPATRYKNAIAAVDAGEYDKAIEMFTALGDYKDSADRIKEITTKILPYEKALDAVKTGKFEEALETFTALGDFRDSAEKRDELINELIPEREYTAAISELETGDYEAATASFLALSGYKDSDEMVKEAKYRHAASLLAYGAAVDYDNIKAARNIFQQIQGYKDTDNYLLQFKEVKIKTTRETGTGYKKETKVSTYYYDEYGRDISGGKAYDEKGRLINSSGNYSYEYDDEDRIIKVCHTPSYTSKTYINSYSYNAQGLLASERYDTEKDGKTEFSWSKEYLYNANGQLIKQVYRSAYEFNDPWTITYEYNSDGKLIKETKSEVSHITHKTYYTYHDYTYDERGELIEDNYEMTNIPGRHYRTTYTYNENGLLIETNNNEYDRKELYEYGYIWAPMAETE